MFVRAVASLGRGGSASLRAWFPAFPAFDAAGSGASPNPACRANGARHVGASRDDALPFTHEVQHDRAANGAPVPQSDRSAIDAPIDFGDLTALADPMRDLGADFDDPLPITALPGDHGHMPLDPNDADPLVALAAEYRQVLLNHQCGYAHALKSMPVDSGPVAFPPPPSPFDEQDSDKSLLDLLASGQNIDTILGDLDGFNGDMLFETDAQHEILTLMAPDNTVRSRFSIAATLAREEHHQVTADSHLQMPDPLTS
ncbi:TagK domain-containing protein [Burkholderia sp. JSH-S8]|nr:TagK domain-containing protein [Burkholderia sp. JSH-S8]